MRRWSKIAVPLGIAAVLVAALAVGFPSPRGEAACTGSVSDTTVYTGRAGSTVRYQFDFCSDPTLEIVASLQWSKASKDFALRVTEPDGTQHLVDHPVGTSEAYRQEGPLPAGTWTVDVINNSPGSVQYALTVTFV